MRKNAPFYAVSNILIVGLLYGAAIGIIVYFVGQAIWPSWAAVVFLSFWGLLSILYLGYSPDPIDWANKAQQTGIVGAISYAVVIAAFFLLHLAH